MKRRINLPTYTKLALQQKLEETVVRCFAPNIIARFMLLCINLFLGKTKQLNYTESS